jgi:hypothetical protein
LFRPAASALVNARAAAWATELVFLLRPSSWAGKCRLLAAVADLLEAVAGLAAAVGGLLLRQAPAPIATTATTESVIAPRLPERRRGAGRDRGRRWHEAALAQGRGNGGARSCGSADGRYWPGAFPDRQPSSSGGEGPLGPVMLAAYPRTR